MQVTKIHIKFVTCSLKRVFKEYYLKSWHFDDCSTYRGTLISFFYFNYMIFIIFIKIAIKNNVRWTVFIFLATGSL